MLKLNTICIIFIAGMIVGILATTLFTLAFSPVYAEATSGESTGIIAVTGLCAQGISGLWVIDARDTKTSPSVCLYVPEGAGKSGFKLTGARRIKYDLQVMTYRDLSEKSMTPGILQRTIEEINKKADEEAAKKENKKP